MAAPKGNQNAKGNRGGTGRPTSYTPRCAATARYVASTGGLDFQVASALDVDVRTVAAWKQRHPEFAAACVVTDETRVNAVACSLYHRAVGYDHPAVKIIATSGGVVKVPFIQHHPPDVAAIKYFLNNRASAKWQDRAPEAERGELVVRIEGGLPDKQSITGSADQALLADS